MGKPREHIPVKLIVGLIAGKPAYFADARHFLEKKYGMIDEETPPVDFSCTHYYEGELGGKLKRKFLSFAKLAGLNRGYEIKLYTNRIERLLSRGGRRPVNIDPGYVSLTKLVLFTTKNRSHRIYLGRGIYADRELAFAKNTFNPLEWTYPDYRTGDYIGFFNTVREKYLSQVKGYLRDAR